MKKTLVLLAVLLSMGLTACSEEDEPAASSEYSKNLENPDEAAITDKEKGYEILQDITEEFDIFSQEEVDNLAENTCSALDAGLTPDDVYAAGSATFGSDIGALMALSTTAYCPQHRAEMERWSDN